MVYHEFYPKVEYNLNMEEGVMKKILNEFLNGSNYLLRLPNIFCELKKKGHQSGAQQVVNNFNILKPTLDE